METTNLPPITVIDDNSRMPLWNDMDGFTELLNLYADKTYIRLEQKVKEATPDLKFQMRIYSDSNSNTYCQKIIDLKEAFLDKYSPLTSAELEEAIFLKIGEAIAQASKSFGYKSSFYVLSSRDEPSQPIVEN